MDFDRMLSYCSALEANNNREWFHANHQWYRDAFEDFYELVEITKLTVASLAPDIRDGIMFLKPKSMVYRVARDMRFYKDRPPYNPAFRAYISPDKKSTLPIGYFIMIAPGGRSCIGTGLYCLESDDIARVRNYILDNGDVFEKIASDRSFAIDGSKLKRVPRGYPADDKTAEWLKHKSWTAFHNFEDTALRDFDSFEKELSSQITKMEPFRAFMTQAMQSRSPNF